ncbi:MAG: pentapeptide repeat-containing protein, partial [Verrucomicrobia bacterium]|nr:pentapeptide repeat-containing protein [Cytophagales bacterium]
MKKLFLLCFLISPLIFAQNRKISIAQLIAQIQQSKADSFVVQNVFVTKDGQERFTRIFSKTKEGVAYVNQLDSLVLLPKVIFENVTFEEGLKLRKITFRKGASFSLVKFNDIQFSNCSFAGNVVFKNTKNIFSLLRCKFSEKTIIKNAVEYFSARHCVFENDTELSGMESGFRFDSCNFGGNNLFRNYQGGSSQFYGCVFEPKMRKNSRYRGYCVPLDMWEFSFGRPANVIVLYNCIFRKATDRDIVNLASNGIAFMGISNSIFEIPVYLHNTRTEELSIEKSTFNYLDLRSFLIPVNNTSLNFKQVSKKIKIK